MSLYDNLLKLKDKLKDKPDEKSKLKRVMSILMRRYDYGVDDMGVQYVVRYIMDPFNFLLFGTFTLVGMILIIYWFMK